LANIRNQPELVQEVVKLLTELKSAWEAIDQMQVKSKELSMPAEFQSILNAGQSEMIANKNVVGFAKA
jgi:flagellar protein FliS